METARYKQSGIVYRGIQFTKLVLFSPGSLWGPHFAYQVVEDRSGGSEVLLVVIPRDDGRPLLPLLVLKLPVQLGNAGVLVSLCHVEGLIDDAVLLDIRLSREGRSAATYILLLLLLFNPPRSFTLCRSALEIFNKLSRRIFFRSENICKAF